jgi:hypothetical protein
MTGETNGAESPWPWPPLYVYDADGGDEHGVRGVTDVYLLARSRLIAALRSMPYGASGTIRQAMLDMTMFPYPDYRYGLVVARARRDRASGAVIFDDGLPGGGAAAGEVSDARR